MAFTGVAKITWEIYPSSTQLTTQYFIQQHGPVELSDNDKCPECQCPFFDM